MGKYDKLKQNIDAQQELEQQLNIASQGFTEMSEDAHRTSEIYRNAETVLNDIDEKFMQETKFNKTDVAFLMLATALQIGRWVLFAELSKALDKKTSQARIEHNDKSIIEMEKEKRNQYKEKHIDDAHIKSKEHRDWANIVFDSVPYDISRGCKNYGVKMEGGYHRIHTLGHDPILGWLFGTINILSDTITLDKTYIFRTFNVEMMNRPKQWTTETNIANAFQNAYDSVQEDINRLPAAVFAQALHLKSDEFTKLGLPIPLLEAFNPELAGKLYKEGYDSLKLLKDIKIWSGQAIVSIIINMLITLIHGLFYDETKYESRELYEVKTRKILLYSNLIATSSNIITVAGMSVASICTENPELGKKALSTLDVGGILVTMYRLITDTKFIRKVKNEFIEKEWYNAVVGDEYKFVAEAKEMGKKDILKGIEIQAKADAAKAEKVAEGLSVQANVLNNIKNTQQEVHQKVDIVIQDKCDQEAALKYGLKTNKRITELDYTEKRVLSAVIYTLMAQNEYTSKLQKRFFECIEAYGVNERTEDFDFKNLRNVDSYSDRRIIMKAVCVFLFLQELNFDFIHQEQYKWLVEFTSQQDVEEVCSEIDREFHILGEDCIISGYLPPINTHSEIETSETLMIEGIAETEENTILEFTQIKEIISKRTANEKAFGKRISKIDQAFINKELGKDYPRVSIQSVVEATRIANGCLIFTTFALYVKTGNIINGRYVRLPYQNIIFNKIHTEEGKFKGTRKLVIPLKNESEEICNVSLDDIKLEEEQLRDLIIEITSLNCKFPFTDEYIELADLQQEILLSFFGILNALLKINEHTLTELFLLLRDFNLLGHWNDFVTVNDVDLEDLVIKFVDSLPYPSEQPIKEEATRVLLQTISRSNLLEGKEATALIKNEEMIIKEFCSDSYLTDADFNILFKNCSKNIRNFDVDTLNKLIADIEDKDVLLKDCIIADLNKIVDSMKEQELAKQNTPVAKFKRTVQNKAIPIAKEVLEKTEKQIAQKLKEKDLNAYPISVDTTDENLSNGYVSETVKELKKLGVDARIHVAQGTIFGYVLCKDTEIDNIIEKFSGNEHYVISNKPVDKLLKKTILDKSIIQ